MTTLDTVLKLHVSKINGASGRFHWRRKGYPRIYIRPGEGQNVAVALFHELLHFWCWWLRKSGSEFSRDRRKEHRFIYRMEHCLEREINRIYGR